MEENISQQQSEAVQTPTNNTPNSIWKSKLLLISGGFLLLVLVGFGGFFLGKILSQPKTSPSSISQLSPTAAPPTQIPTPTSTTDPTANWKTYTNREFKYQLRYPVDWKVAVEGTEDLETAFAPALGSPCRYSEGETCANLDIVPSGEYQEGKSLKDYFGDRFGMAISVKEKKLDGEEALEIEYYNQRTDHPYREPAIEIIAVHNKIVFRLTFTEQSKNQIDEWRFKDTFYLILSTFKFLD